MHLYCDFAESSSFWASDHIGKMSSLLFVIACFALCCSFAAGALFMTECSPLLRIFVCSTLFPLCSLTEVIPPCRDVCFSVHAACHHAYLLHLQEWSTFFNCTNLRARPQVCLFPPSTTSHLSSLSPSSSPLFATSPSSTSSSPWSTSHLSSLSPSSSPPFATSSLSTS